MNPKRTRISKGLNKVAVLSPNRQLPFLSRAGGSSLFGLADGAKHKGWLLALVYINQCFVCVCVCPCPYKGRVFENPSVLLLIHCFLLSVVYQKLFIDFELFLVRTFSYLKIQRLIVAQVSNFTCILGSLLFLCMFLCREVRPKWKEVQ